eukprot:scaffold251358_cov22-Prasinocladus_malaysianus.AAC.1
MPAPVPANLESTTRGWEFSLRYACLLKKAKHIIDKRYACLLYLHYAISCQGCTQHVVMAAATKIPAQLNCN